MTIDEYASLEKAMGADVVNIDGIWWRKVRTFYYQPLFPLLEIVPDSVRPPILSRIGGYKHVVPTKQYANSSMNLIIWDDIQNYSINEIKRRQRCNIKTGMKYFTVKPMNDIDEFISSGHRVYLSFYARTKYSYKNERLNKKYFIQWAEILFNFPKLRILGAYHQGELSAIDISYLIENVLFDATFFSKTEHLKYQVLDLMIHTIRDEAASCPNVKYIYKGAVTGERGLDAYKIMRGCKIISKPAFYKVNPGALLIMKKFMQKEYDKLIGVLDQDGVNSYGDNRSEVNAQLSG